MRKKIAELQDANDEDEQYSRRTCHVFSGIPETPDENTDNKIIQFCHNDLGVDIREDDIERSHRLGKPSQQTHAQGNLSVHGSTTGSARNTPGT